MSYFNGGVGVFNGLPSDESFSGVQGNGSDSLIPEMLGDFKDQSPVDSLDFEGV